MSNSLSSEIETTFSRLSVSEQLSLMSVSCIRSTKSH